MEENKTQVRKVVIILSICIFIFSIFLVSKEMQNDTFFTIRIGNDVFENGMSRVDNLTIHDNIQFIHLRWAFDAIIAILYNLFSFKGIYIFTAIYTGIIGVSFFNVMLKRKINIVIAFIFTIFAMIAASGGFAARAQLISYLLFIIEIYLIEKVIEKKNINDIILLTLLPILIANFHASVLPMYFVLFMPYVAEGIIYQILRKIKKDKSEDSSYSLGKLEIKSQPLKNLFSIMAAGFILGLCSPAFIDGYTYMFKCIGGASSKIINELHNITIQGSYLVWIMFFVFILLLIFKDTKLRMKDFFLILGLGLMAFLAGRNKIFFYFIGTFSMANFIQSSELIMKAVNIAYLRLYKNNLIIIIVCLATAVCSFTFYIVRQKEVYVSNTSYPIKATEYIKENIDIESMRLYNHLNFGSYLELNHIPAFIDSRTEIYCIEFNPNALLVEWNIAESGRDDYDYLFEKYNITHVLLYNSELINIYIKKDKKYEQIYTDGSFTLYKRLY